MDAKTQKLALKIGDRELAGLLVVAGFDNPAKIRKAADGELEAVKGIGKASREKIRERLPKR